MTLGQKGNGTTVNASISVNANSGAIVYNFNDTFDVLVNLTNSSGIVAEDSASGGDDQYLLNNASADTINGSTGNNTFVVASGAGSLNGNILHGGKGFNVVQLQGSAATVDLTQGSTAIDAVVAHGGLTGETVDVTLNQISQSSLTNGGAGPGKAFVALIGATGAVNVTAAANFTLAGVVDASGAGYSASGAALDSSDTAALTAQVTGIGNVEGSLANDYSGAYNHSAAAAAQAYVSGALNAYVFTNGSTSYTVWTDGTVTPSNTGTAVYQPAAAVNPSPVYGTVTQYNQAGVYGVATLGLNPNQLATLLLQEGSATAYEAVLAKGVSGTVIHGAGGANGGDYFGLGLSGGGNFIYGSAAGDTFDLQGATSLVDTLTGGAGFNVVRSTANGADVNLTAAGSTGIAAKGISAVVSTADSTLAGATQTVEVDPNTLNVAVVGGVKTAEFEAMLGSSADTVTLQGAGKWVEVSSFAAGTTPPTNALALTGASSLDTIYFGGKYTAETQLTGYLFEQVNPKGAALKYLTVYTDATVVNALSSPPAALMAQAMAQMAPASPAAVQAAPVVLGHAPFLAAGHA